jgi:acetyl esterase
MKRLAIYAVTALLLNTSVVFADSPVLQKDTQKFIDDLNKQGGKPIYTLTPNEARAVLSNAQANPTWLAPAVVVEKSIEVDGKKINLHVMRPKTDKKMLPVIMYFHGGGWVLGDFKTHERFLRELTNAANAAIVFVDYSPAPEAKYPTQINEAYAATQWIAENGKDLQLDTTKIAVAGDSVGGNMAIAVTLMAKEKQTPKIDFQLLFYPVTDANFDTGSYKQFENGPWLTKKAMQWFWDAYLPNKEDGAKITASPLRASITDLQGLPPAFIITDQNDVLRDEGEAYANKLMQAGVPVTSVRYLGTVHDFVMLNALSQTPAAREAINQAGHALWWVFNSDSIMKKKK